MTEQEQHAARELVRCTFIPGSWDKRFARDMYHTARHQPEKELTEKQTAHLFRLVYRYRKQIQDRALLEYAKPFYDKYDHPTGITAERLANEQ